MQPELERLLRIPSLDPTRTGRVCTNEAELAAYADGALNSDARRSFESHIADCKSCLEQLSFLVRSHESAPVTDVPVELLARAKSLVRQKRTFTIDFSWRWATAALAACLVLVGLLALAGKWRRETSKPAVTFAGVVKPQPSFAPQPATRNPDAFAYANSPAAAKPSTRKSGPEVPVTRGANADGRTPILISPREGEVIKEGSFTFKWQSVPEVLSYELLIRSESGELVLSLPSEAPALTVPSDPRLKAGAKYFVSVRAQFRDGRTANSRGVSFRVIGQYRER